MLPAEHFAFAEEQIALAIDHLNKFCSKSIYSREIWEYNSAWNSQKSFTVMLKNNLSLELYMLKRVEYDE
jgi:hypothetical protein